MDFQGVNAKKKKWKIPGVGGHGKFDWKLRGVNFKKNRNQQVFKLTICL